MYPVVVVAAVCLLYTEFLQAASVCLDAGNVTCAVMVHNVTGKVEGRASSRTGSIRMGPEGAKSQFLRLAMFSF